MNNYDLRIIGTIDNNTLYTFLNLIEGKKDNKVSIFLCSSGGSAEIAIAINDLIKINKLNVTIHCFGEVESCALTILNAGSKKLSSKTCIFGSHSVSVGNNRNLIKQFFLKRKHKKKVTHFETVTKETQPLMQQKNKIKYYTAGEMMDMGLIDSFL